MVLDLADLEGGNSTGSQQAALPSISDDPEVIPRAWWRANEDRTVYRGVEGSVAAFKEVVAKEGPFDVSGLHVDTPLSTLTYGP